MSNILLICIVEMLSANSNKISLVYCSRNTIIPVTVSFRHLFNWTTIIALQILKMCISRKGIVFSNQKPERKDL